MDTYIVLTLQPRERKSIVAAAMLDELQEHVEFIDMENDFHTIGGLVPLFEHLKNSSAGIRAKAAKVMTVLRKGMYEI
ncbi:hypothetical protein C5167_047876 [Papaver somniferum]|uniref:Condensin complex subunit 1 C-terminal domain-containing protein n=1 Tax=Papaver somniferum TaxID=3469 RepID=A0A4Y7LM04_PAPSO|nr:hypothetical protein C5167_047876 [Papaver somniferum]